MSNTIKGEVPGRGNVVGRVNVALGKDGDSAYEIACRNGFEGTEQEWLDSLNGGLITVDKQLYRSGHAADAAVTGEKISDLSGKITKEIADRETALAVERARIDNLATLKEGSTTGDAELMDIRVGPDGRIYNSAGEAVRNQFSELNDLTPHIYTKETGVVYSFSAGGIRPETGANQGSTLIATKTNYILCGVDIYANLGLADYMWQCWSYKTSSVSNATHANSNGWVSGLTPILAKHKDGDNYIRFAFKRVDGAEMTSDFADPDSDWSRIKKAIRFFLSGATPKVGVPVPVKSAWEQRMLERIDLAMIPTISLRTMPKTSGYIDPGTVMTGINYSAVFESATVGNLVGAQVSLSTYYSALENPASKMYTEDKYQGDGGKSTFYGINCSSFVSYAYGWDEWMWTTKMGETYADKVIPIETENDLFNIRRGDMIINTVVSHGNGDHVKLVKDIVIDQNTGRLIGFNVAESWKPYVRVVFLSLAEFLAQMYEAQPYRVVRLEDNEYGLDVTPVKYSKSVYPDKGDGGKYSVGETAELYIPDETATAIHMIHSTIGSASLPLANLTKKTVNDVTVYEFPLSAGEYTIWTDTAADDPCTVIVN